MSINTPNQLKTMLEAKLTKAFNQLTDWIYGVLLDNIDYGVYETYEPTEYKRTKDFRNKAWVKDKAEKISNILVGGLHYDGMQMSINASKHQHALNLGKGRVFDMRPYLAEVLNSGGGGRSDWTFGRPQKPDSEGEDDYFVPTIPFWEPTINFIDENWSEKLESLLRKQGLKII